MFKVTTEADFCAAHKLVGYAGKCANLHGHNFRVSVTVVRKRLNSLGLAVDFVTLKGQLKSVIDTLDHTYLNELSFFHKKNPSCENITVYIHRQLKKHFKTDRVEVTVWESVRNSITYAG